MKIGQGQVLSSAWKRGFWLPRTSKGFASSARRSKYRTNLDHSFKSRWRRWSIVKSAQGRYLRGARSVRDEDAYTGQGDDVLSASGPGGSRRPPDEIDRLIGRVALYIRNPGAAVVDVWKFVANALRMAQFLHAPALYPSLVRSILVLAVVMLFCAVVFGLDKGLSLLFTNTKAHG